MDLKLGNLEQALAKAEVWPHHGEGEGEIVRWADPPQNLDRS